jgi:hypothetical protein
VDPRCGTGHVVESTDGGAPWTDISVLLPDVPSDALVLSGGKLLPASCSAKTASYEFTPCPRPFCTRAALEVGPAAARAGVTGMV